MCVMKFCSYMFFYLIFGNKLIMAMKHIRKWGKIFIYFVWELERKSKTVWKWNWKLEHKKPLINCNNAES